MSTAPRYEPHYSVSDYLQWEGEWELWNGTAVAMSPSPLGPHERAAAKLVFQIESCLQAQGCTCATYAGLDWIVSDDTVVRPDVMVVCGSQPGRHLERPPALAIEILGDATADKDRTAKRRLYELTGVGHYLLVDPIVKTIEWLELDLPPLMEPVSINRVALPMARHCPTGQGAEFAASAVASGGSPTRRLSCPQVTAASARPAVR